MLLFMSELLPIRAFIVDDDEWKTNEMTSALVASGHIVVATAVKAYDVRDLYEAGEITTDNIDVVFVDSQLGLSSGGGKEVVRYLFMQNLVRRPIGDNSANEPVLVDPNKIVTVGASTEPEWANELGSYSDTLSAPLILDWKIRPLKIASILNEVRRLKPRA